MYGARKGNRGYHHDPGRDTEWKHIDSPQYFGKGRPKDQKCLVISSSKGSIIKFCHKTDTLLEKLDYSDAPNTIISVRDPENSISNRDLGNAEQ
jgi:hypothetical protein